MTRQQSVEERYLRMGLELASRSNGWEEENKFFLIIRCHFFPPTAISTPTLITSLGQYTGKT